jgi:hypothetical protein
MLMKNGVESNASILILAGANDRVSYTCSFCRVHEWRERNHVIYKVEFEKTTSRLEAQL